MDNTKFLPDDFELVGDKQNINIDEVLPSRPMWQDILGRFKENKGDQKGEQSKNIFRVHQKQRD